MMREIAPLDDSSLESVVLLVRFGPKCSTEDSVFFRGYVAATRLSYLEGSYFEHWDGLDQTGLAKPLLSSERFSYHIGFFFGRMFPGNPFL